MKILGQGTYGVVRLATDKLNSSIKYAIKSMSKERVSNRTIYLLKREIEALMHTDHPNIIKLYEVYEDEEYYHLVMEYCEGGDLFERFIEGSKIEESLASDVIN